MKKLVLHSDQVGNKTQVDENFINIFFPDHLPKIAYIPSCSDNQDRIWFKKKIEWYKQFSINDLFYFDIDQEYDETKTNELLSCDAIFLSGGNTYYFLNLLKKRNLIPILKNFIENGGVLIGVSAGSIIMSKNITMAGIYDGDENSIGLKDQSALGLNEFDFYPHFDKNNPELINKLQNYSQTNQSTIYACQDGDGIIVDGDNLKFFGEVLKIEQGNISIV